MRLMFESVTCRYGWGRPALTGVNLELGTGLWVLTGPNGSGKSTLIRCAAGLLPPAAGRLCWNGEDAYRADARYRQHLGYAPQEVGGYPELAVRGYLTYLAALKGIRPSHRPGRVQAMMALLELTAFADDPAGLLSGGMKHRLGLAQALLNDPDLLLLDEPSAGLDPGERARFRQLLLDLSADRIVLVATNIPDDVDGMADGIIRLQDGHVASFDDR